MEFPRRVFDGEGVKADVDFGPTLMLNRNRCILCTRCVRFMHEIDADAQISIVERGNGSEIATFQEQGVHSLLSGNLMDVCPVGAITTRDYRFKSRPWDNPDAVDTICTLCSKGCNTTAWIKAKPEWAKGARLVRLTPRFNPTVNGYWMCDIGRFDYHWIEGDERLQQPLVRDGGGHQQPTTWDATRSTALGERATRSRRRPHVPRCRRTRRNEELFLDRSGSRELPEIVASAGSTREKPQPAGAKFKVPPVDAPNVNGARDLGLPGRRRQRRRAGPGRAPRATSKRARWRRSTCSIPARTARSATSSWVVAARQSGKLPLLVYQGVLMTDARARPPTSCCRARRGSRRTAPTRTTRAACRPAANVFARAGRRAGRPRDLLQVGRALGAAAAVHSRPPTCARPSPRTWRTTRPTRRSRDQLRAAGHGEALAAGVEPVRALEVGLHVPGSQHARSGTG